MARPIELDDLKAKRIVDAIAAGNSRACAAALCGLNARTVTNWIRRGRDGEAEFVPFYRRVMEADGKAEEKMVRSLVEAATIAEKPDWKAALAWLKHRRNKTWHEAQTQVLDEKELEGMPEERLLELAGYAKVGGTSK